MTTSSLTESLRETLRLFDGSGAPRTTVEVADSLDLGRRSSYERLERLVDHGELETKNVGASGRVWWRPPPSTRQSPGSERELELFRTLLDRSTDSVLVVDPDTGQYVDVNETACQRRGYSREEFLELSVPDIQTELDDQTDWRSLVDDLRASGSITFGGHHRRKDGTTYPVEVNASHVELDGEYVLATARDVTERRARERELERTERRFEAVFEDPNILVGLLEPDGTVLDINRTAMEYIDADLEAVTGEPFWETPWWGKGDDVQDDAREWTERAAAGEYVEFEADLTRPDGEPYTLSGYFRPVTDDNGEVVSIIVSDRDVTERKQRERELEESERRYRTLVENFPNGAVALVDEDIRYQTVGGSPTDTGDVTAEEAEASPVAETVPPKLAEKLVPAYEAAFEGETTRFETESTDRIYQFQVVPVSDDGEVFAALGMSQDITEREEAKRKLEESERRYRTLIENFPNGAVGLFDDDLRYQISGGQALEEVGTDREEIVGKTLWERYPEEVAERLEPKFRAALAGETSEFEWEFHDRYWHAYTIPIRDESGAVFAGMIMVQEITERKERERELKRNRDQLETLFEVLPVGVVVAEADGEIVTANDTAHTIWGGDVFDADSVEEYEQYSVRWADSGERVEPEEMTLARVLRGEEVREPDVFEIDAVDGKRRVIEAEGMPIRNETGEVSRGVVTLTDRTERREAQRKLEESERRYRTLIENFPNGSVGLFDQDLRYTAIGGQLFDQLDFDPEDRIGHSISDLHPPDLVEEIRPYFHAALEGEANSFEREYGGRYLHAQTLPVRDADGEIFAGMLVVQDDTERREYQHKLEESNERLEQFAYAASHDLQEPLRMVTSYLQLLENRYGDAFDEDGEEFLEFAIDGAERMRDMIDGLLEYSRVETRGDPFEPTDLNAVLEEVLADLQVRIEESDAEITAEDLPRIEGDASQLRRVLQNLLSNALIYSGDEPPRIHIKSEWQGDEWVISVRDGGIGIAPEDQDRVFTVFDRLHSREEYDGTGIGLALCERIVERHDGEIWVDSEPGKETTFSFTLPASSDQ